MGFNYSLTPKQFFTLKETQKMIIKQTNNSSAAVAKNQSTNRAAALNEAFELGVDAFKKQLGLLNEQQYVQLLKLLNAYHSPLRA